MITKTRRSTRWTLAVVASAALVAGLTTTDANALTFKPITSGDIVASLTNGQVNEYSPTGSLIQTLIASANTPTGSAFDASGNLYVTEFGANDILKVDGQTGAESVFSTGTILADGTSFNSPESIAFGPGYTKMYVSDANRNGTGGGIHIVDPATGKGIGFFNLPSSSGSLGAGESDWLAFSPSASLYMTNENSAQGVMKVDQTTGDIAQPSFEANLPDIGYAISFDPNGDLWLSDTSKILEYAPSGSLIRTITNPSFSTVFSAVFNPPFNTIYAGDLDTGNIFTYDLNGNLQNTFNVGSGVLGLSVAGTVIVPSGSIVSNAFGNVVNGKPGTSQTWTLGGFDTRHTVTFGEGISCFTVPGCPLDNWSATVNWGDSSATSTAKVLCLVPPPPGPAPTPPPPVGVHCTIQGSHTYSTRGAYPISMVLSNSGTTIKAEAEITSPPKMGEIKASVGEMVAYDSTGPNAVFIPCTATTILSANQLTVVTAAHCVGNLLDGGHVYSFLRFAPGHTGPTCPALEGCGTNPFGVFQAAASDVTIVPDVVNKQRLDWALIRFAPLAGSKLGQVVPGLAIEFNAPTGETWTAIGYPHGKQVGPPGQYQLFYKTCSGSSTTFDGSPPPPGPLQLIIASCGGSGLTEGSSGGPWLAPAGAVGAVNKAIGGAGLLGTYLGGEAQAAFLTVSLG